MSPVCLTGRYAGKGITVVNLVPPQMFVALITRFQRFYAIAKRDRFEYLKRSLSIAHIMASGDTCPKGPRAHAMSPLWQGWKPLNPVHQKPRKSPN